jgi:hypothetical protein
MVKTFVDGPFLDMFQTMDLESFLALYRDEIIPSFALSIPQY